MKDESERKSQLASYQKMRGRKQVHMAQKCSSKSPGWENIHKNIRTLAFVLDELKGGA